MIKVGIVDDERHARENIQMILKNHCPGTIVVWMAGTFMEAQQLIKEKPPGLLFLDIELPDGSGFDLMPCISPQRTRVVFVSAHEDRGAETYEHRALSYITKPIRIVSMQKAVELYKETIAMHEPIDQINSMKPSISDDFLVANESDGYRLVSLDHIVFVRANRNCSEVHLVNDTHQVFTLPIKEIEDRLPFPEFLRTHRSYIVNCRFISKVCKGKRGDIELYDGKIIPMSEDYAEDIRLHVLQQAPHS
ncbi:MAG: LytTR family DNA-binding domain-containing protein [Bacteroidia bacterium]